jgi:NAD dependent epimerase/dehydratase family enzyme
MPGIIAAFTACAQRKVWLACDRPCFQTVVKVPILITGGTGLIGRQLCTALLADGHELTVLSRNPAAVPEKCGAGVQTMASLAEWQPERSFDAVINLAGEPIVDARWTGQRKQTLWDSRITLTKMLVQRIAATQRKPAVLLSGSAVGY